LADIGQSMGVSRGARSVARTLMMPVSSRGQAVGELHRQALLCGQAHQVHAQAQLAVAAHAAVLVRRGAIVAVAGSALEYLCRYCRGFWGGGRFSIGLCSEGCRKRVIAGRPLREGEGATGWLLAVMGQSTGFQWMKTSAMVRLWQL